jgi:tetratricopeptide (TPR) repeat protein
MEDSIKNGTKHYNDGNLREAANCFLSVIQMNPYHMEALNNLGVIAYQGGSIAEATNYLLKALSHDPYYREAALNLADILRETGQLTAMMSLAKKLVRYDPRDKDIRNLLDEIYRLSYFGDDDRGGRICENGDSFFVLSAGNCGTGAIAELLRPAPNVRVFHHPDSYLEDHLLACYWGDEDRRKRFLDARKTKMEKTWQEGLIYGETTASVTLFWDLLAADYPRAKFIIAARDPFTFVQSALYRNFYQGHPDDAKRLQPAPENRNYSEWKQSSQIERICWLWREIYGFILQGVHSLGNSRVMTLRMEDLAANTQHVNRQLLTFLNLKDDGAADAGPVALGRSNASAYGRFPQSEDWSSELRSIVGNLCGPVAGTYGYDFPERSEKNKMPANVGPAPSMSFLRSSNKPKVTIGLPLYSGGRMLMDAVESILAQDFENFELIISDHGSDPFVREIGDHWCKLDSRVKYVHTGDGIHYLGIHNMARLIELSTADFFMWASYDDRMEKPFISSCLKVLEQDDAIALVYPRSKVFNQSGEYIGPGADTVKADSDDPYDRFIHVIWELQMCNAFYGLFRRRYMRKTRSLYKNCYAHDNLFLAEIALLGKIVQIADVLFIRGLTRNYNVTMDEHHADVLNSADPLYLEEGLTLPFCRFTYAHCELINHSPLPPERKEYLTGEILRCFRQRWTVQLNYEIERMIYFIKNRVYYQTWDGRAYRHDLKNQTPHLFYFHLTDLLKSIREALFIFPDHQELQQIFEDMLKEKDYSKAHAFHTNQVERP